ncbi:MAG: ATP-binding protein [Methanomassiliicoccaceae archaeon]|jgi:predicted AAA+ superfamily ATPase|nr:ATP-binding protein [Methanomassiliicoccaceae archaeon]
MFIERHMSVALQEMRRSFPVVLVTGSRQVGKTTLLRNELKGMSYFTFDDYILLDSVKEDAIGFIRANDPPLIIDEVQYAPELMRVIKMRADESGKSGEYFLTGSQQFQMMKNVSESLAGRIGILNLTGLSAREIDGDAFNIPFIPTEGYYAERQRTITKMNTKALWARIHKGGMPKLHSDRNEKWERYYSAYVKTYIERDVRALTQVGDELTFMQFITACAARTGELLNMAAISRDVGISEPTAKRWLSILQTSDIIHLLQPFSLNITSRVVKMPKIYFMDTGLAAYLCKWLTPETLEKGAMAGNMFETYAISEIIKSYRNIGREPPIYFYRDADKREIDLIMHQDGTLYPIEIKKTSSPNAADVKHFETLKRFTTLKVADGGIICTYDKVMHLSGGNRIIPINYI